MSIRISDKDKKEFAKLKRNVQAKVNRVKKRYGVDLSGVVSVPSTVEEFAKRKDFNRWKESARDFTNRYNTEYQFKKNKYDVVASVKEINDITRKTKIAQNRAKERLEEVRKKGFFVGGKEHGTLGEREDLLKRPDRTGVTVPVDFDFNKIQSRARLKQKKEQMERRSEPDFHEKAAEQMRENFIDSVRASLVRSEHLDRLVEKLESMSGEDFFDMYGRTPDFDFEVYDSEGQFLQSEVEAEGHISRMLDFIERYERGQINKDLKGF